MPRVLSYLSASAWSPGDIAKKPLTIAVATGVKKVNLENSSLKDFLKSGRINGDTFYAVTLPSWDNLTNEQKEEALKKIISFGAGKGFTKVHLFDKDGKTVGFDSTEKAEVIAP